MNDLQVPLSVQTDEHPKQISVKDIITDVDGSNEYALSDAEKGHEEQIDTSKLFALAEPAKENVLEKVVEDILQYQSALANNELIRSRKESVINERNSACRKRPRKLNLNHIIQFPYLGERYSELEAIAYAQSKVSPNSDISIESHLASIIGQYAGTRVLTGEDVGFWRHEEAVRKRSKRQDNGMDIVGMTVDFKSSLIKHDSMSRNLSILDYATSVKPHMLNRSKIVYVQTFVAFLRTKPCAIVYLTGWARGDDFPEMGSIVRSHSQTEYMKELHTLFQYQMAPIMPVEHMNNNTHIQLQIHNLVKSNDSRYIEYFNDNYRYLPWVDFKEDELIEPVKDPF